MHKLGIISDIHGDIVGLQRALRLLENDLAVDEIVCNGDLVDRGVTPGQVIATIRERNIATVMGNHDRSAPQVERSMRNAPELRQYYATEPLTDADIAFLERLPPTLAFMRAGVRLFMAHGSPWNVATYVTPNALRKVVLRVLSESNADVTLLGHTHQPMLMTIGEQMIVNSGSVSSVHDPALPQRTCAVLQLPERRFTVYNVDTAETVRHPHIKYPPPRP